MVQKRKYYTITEVSRIFDVHPNTIRRLEQEGLIAPRRDSANRRQFCDDDLERIRTIFVFSRELGVNRAGVEVIMRMRERMINMQRQVDEIFKYLYRQVEKELAAAETKPDKEDVTIIEIKEIKDEK
jgi:MerR family transcriptional regulator/heat shock protein HspR